VKQQGHLGANVELLELKPVPIVAAMPKLGSIGVALAIVSCSLARGELAAACPSDSSSAPSPSENQIESARAIAELGPADWTRLEEGEPVVHERTIAEAGRKYVGGVTFLLLDHAPAKVAAVLQDVRSYGHVLPRLRSIRWIALARTGDPIVQVEQGTSVAHGRYAVRLHQESHADDGADTISFVVDPRYGGDIRNAHGFFHIAPQADGRSLLVYEVFVDLGSGLFKHFFEAKVQAVALSTPVYLRRYLQALDRRDSSQAQR
jgi:hypothetical protein